MSRTPPQVLEPMTALLNTFLGWGAHSPAEQTQRRIQMLDARTMRAISQEQRDRESFELKQALMVAKLEKLELENERLRRELGETGKPFNPSY